VNDADTGRLERYESRTAVPMTVLAVAFLFVYSTPIIWTSAPTIVGDSLRVLNVSIWAVFVGDLVIRAVLSGKPVSYIVSHPIDVLLVALPMLRPLRVLRVFTALQVLMRQGGRISIGRTLAGASSAALLLMFIAAVAMLDAEQGQGGPIRTFPDALWWSGAAVTTVGYGDMYPVTWVGRSVAFALMVVGVSLIGVVTASIAAWFVGREQDAEGKVVAESIAAWFVGREQDAEGNVVAEIRALREEVARLRAGRSFE
jgi:voltage-gated potassium channel